MEDNKKVFVINLEKVDIPKFEETRYLDWIKYGDDNQFPNHLQDFANNSSLHNAILSSKVDYSCGEGITYEESENKKTAELLEEVYPNESFEDFFRKIVYDYVIYGMYAFSVTPSKDGLRPYYKHYPIDKLRCSKKNQKGEITAFYYSNDWKNYRKTENLPIIIPAYGFGKKNEEQMVYYKDYVPGCDYYALPSYVGALDYIQCDKEIGQFHLSHLNNGMMPGHAINFYGIPEPDERKNIIKNITEKQTGTANAGKVFVTFADDNATAPTVTTIGATDLDKQFSQLGETVLQQILSGHKIISPMLVGIKTEGQLGGSSELENAFNIFYSNIIKPIQKNCLREVNKINKKYGISELTVVPSMPISFQWSEGVLSTIMTKDEMREKIGLDPLGQINESENKI